MTLPIFKRALEPLRSRALKWLSDRQPGGFIWDAGAQTDAGTYINADTAMRLAAVNACVRVLAEDVAALPLHVYMRTSDGGKERARSHPLYEILHDMPNSEMSAFAFKEAMMVSLLLGGNAYAYVEYDGAGRVTGLYPLLCGEVTPYRETDGELHYRVASDTLPAYRILHIPGLSFDGILGLSPIAYARESIGLGQAAERYGARFFKDGTHLGGVINLQGPSLSDEAYDRTRTQFAELYSGLQRAHGLLFLEQGSTYTPVGVAPEDAQFLETRKYQRTEIAAMYRVPPHMIGDLEHATFSNIEHLSQDYLQRSLLPWLERIEQAMTIRLLLPSERKKYLIEHDTGNYLKGDTQSRFNAYAVGIQNGILTPNEARTRENLNPVDGGDDIMLPLNMMAASNALDLYGKPAKDDDAKDKGKTP